MSTTKTRPLDCICGDIETTLQAIEEATERRASAKREENQADCDIRNKTKELEALRAELRSMWKRGRVADPTPTDEDREKAEEWCRREHPLSELAAIHRTSVAELAYAAGLAQGRADERARIVALMREQAKFRADRGDQEGEADALAQADWFAEGPT